MLTKILLIIMFLLSFSTGCAQDTEQYSYEEWVYTANTEGLTLLEWNGSSVKLTIPEKINNIPVTSLGEGIFKNNHFIESVALPSSIKEIGKYAFHGCTNLKEINIPDSITKIEPYTFRYCTSIEEIVFPKNLTNIGSYSFSGCTLLNKVTIPDSVTNLGESVFEDCKSLTDVYISKNLNFIEGNCFRNTPWLSSKTDEFLFVGNSILLKYNGDKSVVEIPYGVTMITDAFYDNKNIESIFIPGSVTRIGANAFRGAVNLKSITIPYTVTRIDSYAFQDCRSLKTIDIPDSIRSLGASVFRGCEKLQTFRIPTGVTALNSSVFADCTSLKEVFIPASVENIHDTCFSNTPELTLQVTYNSAAESFAVKNNLPMKYTVEENTDYFYTKSDKGIKILKYKGDLFDVEIPRYIDGFLVTEIGPGAFQGNQIVRSITIPYTIDTIDDWAFSYMDKLTYVYFSEGLRNIGKQLFTGSYGIKTIYLPQSIELIGMGLFSSSPEVRVCTSGEYVREYLINNGYAENISEDCSNSGM